MKKILVIILLLVSFLPSAYADLLCAKKKARAKNGKVPFAKSLQATTDATCPKGYSPVFDSGVAITQGPSGPVGLQGPAGVLDIHRCRSVSESSVDIAGANDVAIIDVACEPDEFLLTHAGSTSDLTTSPISVNFTAYGDEGFPAGVVYWFGRLEPQNTNTVGTSVMIICCPE